MVGRGSTESFCFLLSEADSETARERLMTLTQTNDGFAIAEKDLFMRGPGEFLGQRQHGMNELAAAKLAGNMAALNDARARHILRKQRIRRSAGIVERSHVPREFYRGKLDPPPVARAVHDGERAGAGST